MKPDQASGPKTVAANNDGSEPAFLRIIQQAVMIVTGVFLIFLMKWLVIDGLPHSLELAFNWYALLQIGSFVIVLVALVLALRLQSYSHVQLWLCLLLLGVAFWSGGLALSWLGTTPEAAGYWSAFATTGATFIPTALFLFTLAYTGSPRARQPLVFVVLICASLLMLYVNVKTNVIEFYDGTWLMERHAWGYRVPVAEGYWLFASWFVGVGLASLAHLYSYWRKTAEPVMRKQAKVVAIALTIPLIGGGITDAVLPVLGVIDFPPLGVTLCSIMGIMLSYGIVRYRYFSFSPNAVANQILATMNEAVLGMQPDMRITYANAAAERLLGISSREFYKRRLTEFLTQQLETSQLKDEFHWVLNAKGFGTINSVDLRSPNGVIKTVKMSITKVVGGGDQPNGYLVVLTDITPITQATLMIERQVAAQTKTVRETKTQLLSSVNSLSFGFLITDDRPEIVMVNNVAHKLFCNNHDHEAAACPTITLEHIQKKCMTDAPLMKAIQDCIEKQEPQRIKTTVFNHRTWRIFISPMIDGQSVNGTVVFVQDITEEQILARSRDEFFSIASHELRTPLTAIKGNASLMMQYYADSLNDPSLKEMVGDIHESSERLITIVNDFLDVSRLEQGRVAYQFEEVSVGKVVEKVMYEMSATTKEAGIHLKVGPGLKHAESVPHVIADPGRLKQILYNLIGNAVKFTKKGGVTIDASATAHHLRLTVTDTGRGIPIEMQPLLFHKFQQAGESLLTRDSSKGTGLGLYISRLLARGMGGMLVLDRSEPNKGSTFVLTLPVATAARLKKLQQQNAAELEKQVKQASPKTE